MIDKKELIKEIEREFEKTKEELGFNASLEDLEEAFRIYDGVVSSEFVSTNFSRQICSRILDNFMGWHNYLNGILMPNAGFLASQTEANLFNNKGAALGEINKHEEAKDGFTRDEIINSCGGFFGIESAKETIEAEEIHPYDEDAGRRYMKYVPWWA